VPPPATEFVTPLTVASVTASASLTNTSPDPPERAASVPAVVSSRVSATPTLVSESSTTSGALARPVPVNAPTVSLSLKPAMSVTVPPAFVDSTSAVPVSVT
jgi:hypothetical protein